MDLSVALGTGRRRRRKHRLESQAHVVVAAFDASDGYHRFECFKILPVLHCVQCRWDDRKRGFADGSELALDEARHSRKEKAWLFCPRHVPAVLESHARCSGYSVLNGFGLSR